ncbi:hypothetical protein G5V58_02440 [Nocardioides anomalus]|uniref:LTD domain-containing protein n=1 Tax=Nocardioides anomalus TaxID=2712223 RepID=A0A6G6W988_9ACTN|nr:putative Ig domain-containing protein [Nocardioides anomalus]QIG41786.1 hypothetical protein G5V58_02440 [Nocardioides anomalus]
MIDVRSARALGALIAAVLGVCTLGLLAPSAPAAAAAPTPSDLVIAAVWGANSDTGQWTNDWVELYNPTDHDIVLGTNDGGTVTSNYYQCYRANAAATQKCSTTVGLYGTVKAHHYFLVWYPSKNTAGVTYTYPPGLTPDVDFAKKTAANGQQVGTDMGGCNTGGQLLLLNSATAGAATFKGDLSSPAARAAGVVDGLGWTANGSTQPDAAETNGNATITGVQSGTTNGCVLARTLVDGTPLDTDVNRTDIAPVAPASFTVHSQISDHVAVAPVADTTVSRGETMPPLQVQGSKGTGALTYDATGLPDGLALDHASGVISGTPAAGVALQGYPVTVTVTDSSPTGAETATTTFTLTVSSTLRVDPLADTSVRKGEALAPIQVGAHGGVPGYHYAATDLPTGVGIDADSGRISGTPTGPAGRYRAHVTVTDSGAGQAAQSVTVDLTLVVKPPTAPPAGGDPLAGLRINEVHATGTPAQDWVELVNTGAAVAGASVRLADRGGDTATVTVGDVPAGGFAVVEGSVLHAAGVDLAADDTLDLTETDDTVLDETAWSAHPTTSWARYPDGTGDFTTSKEPTKGAANAVPATYATDHLVVAAVFGANSDTARWTNDWVELYNPTDAPIVLGTVDTSTTPSTVTSNYALCYRSYSVTGACNLVQLSGTVQPHHHFFVWYGNAHTPADHGTFPAGFTPDLDASVKTPGNGNQAGSNMGGCNTGGQLQLLDATRTTTAFNGDLASPAARAAGVVDGVGWMNASTNQPVSAESAGSPRVSGVDSGTNNTCVVARRSAHGFLVDSDANRTDFAPVADLDSFPARSQHDERVSVSPVADAELSIGEAMDPIRVEAQAVFGDLVFSAEGLPGGLTVDPHTGVVSGTPDAADEARAYPVTVTVSDAVPSDTATVTFTLTLGTQLRLEPVADRSVQRGTPLTVALRAHGGSAPYTFAATGLPAGVTLDPATGALSGTPTGALGRYAVHVTVTDSATTPATVARDLALVVLPPAGGPAAGDPLAGLRLNEVVATGDPARDWVELVNTGAAVTGASLALEDSAGETYALPAQAIAGGGFVVVDSAALVAAGLHLAADDTLYLTEADGTLLDQTTYASYPPTSWARTTDGTGAFGVSAYPTKGQPNAGAPVIAPNDLLVTEVNYDNNSTDYYEYSEVTNTTDHPIDFAAYGLSLRKSGAIMTLHDPADTSQASPVVDPVIPAHGTRLFWWVENQYFGVKTTAQFRANYGLAASTPVVLVYGFSSMANSGGDHSFDVSVNQGGTLISRASVDTPCAAGTFNGASVCPATNNNYAEHYRVPADRTVADATVWYNSLAAGGDDVNHPLGTRLSTPTTVDLEQLGATRAVRIASVSGDITLHNTGTAPVDLTGYVLQKNAAGATYPLPAGTTVAGGADLVVTAADSGLSLADRDYLTLLAPRGYAYSDGVGIADTTGPLLRALPYDASSGQDPVIDPTTGLPLPPAGGLYRPAGISARNGTVYVSNTGDNVLATMADGSNTVIAGSLEGHGDVGDEGPAVDAFLYQPGGLAEDAQGNVYVADSGDNVVRKITADGVIHRFAGTGVAGGPGAAVTPTSTPLTVNLWHPNDVAVDAAGNVFIADTSDNRVLEVTVAGAVEVLAGTGRGGYAGDGAAATSARLAQPAGVAVDAHDNVYVADSSNNVIRRVDATSGVITTVAGDYAAGLAQGTCLGGYGGDGGPATSARLNDPQGVALDGAGDLFIADTLNHAIRQVDPDGTITTLVNDGAVPGAGNTSPVGGGSIPSRTRLNTPYAVAVDPVTDVLYIADTKNNVVEEVLHAARAGGAAGPLEPVDQIPVTGSGSAGTACAVLANGPVASAAAPSVTGTRVVGSTLTADPGQWTPTPDSFTYQWLRDGVAIPGAEQASYTTTAADGGHVVSVAVTAVKAEFAPASATSAAVPIAPATAPTLTTGTPTLSAPVRVGVEVTASPGSWRAGSAGVTSFAFQWLRDGVAIPGATGPSYTPTAADRPGALSVTVTGTYAGYQTATAGSAAVPVRAGRLEARRPQVRGRAAVGHRLHARAGRWKAGPSALADRHLHYQWFADGERIAGATGARYLVRPQDRGARLSVEVTGSAPGYATTTRSSRPTRAVTAR